MGEPLVSDWTLRHCHDHHYARMRTSLVGCGRAVIRFHNDGRLSGERRMHVIVQVADKSDHPSDCTALRWTSQSAMSTNLDYGTVRRAIHANVEKLCLPSNLHCGTGGASCRTLRNTSIGLYPCQSDRYGTSLGNVHLGCWILIHERRTVDRPYQRQKVTKRPCLHAPSYLLWQKDRFPGSNPLQ